jgi:hypothetical protein
VGFFLFQNHQFRCNIKSVIMSLVKTIDKGDEVVKLFNHQLLGGEKVTIDGKTYWMMVEKKFNLKLIHKSLIKNLC